MINDIIRGGGYFARGIALIRKPKIRRWAVIPVFLSTLVFAVFVWLSLTAVEGWVDDASSWFLDTTGFDWLGPILWVLFGLLWVLLSAYTFVIVASIVAAPFNALLAEAVEFHQTGNKPPGEPMLRTMKRLPIILVQETKKILYFLLWSIPVGIACVVCMFVLPPVAPFLWGTFSGWMMALEFSDYPMDNHRLNFRQMRQAIARKRSTSFGFGVTCFLFATIPVLNILTVPAAVCGATLMWIEELKALHDEAQLR